MGLSSGELSGGRRALGFNGPGLTGCGFSAQWLRIQFVRPVFLHRLLAWKCGTSAPSLLLDHISQQPSVLTSPDHYVWSFVCWGLIGPVA